MPRSYFHVLLVLNLLIVLAFSTLCGAASLLLDEEAIDRFVLEQMQSHGIPGLALAITQGSEVRYIKGYGSAGDGEPVTPQTQFFIASVSKSFTALAVMQLVEAGKLTLDVPVRTYLPEFTLADPTVAAQITIRHLLNHTSGLADKGFPEMQLPQPATVAERVASLRTARPIATPGAEFHYFNPNYGVLARVVEVVSGQSFSRYLRTHIFAPLLMEHTYNVVTAADVALQADHLAQGHIVAYGFPVAVSEMSGYLGGSGGVISTANDMAQYLIMQNDGGRLLDTVLLSREGMRAMHMPAVVSGSNYAMGWFVTQEDGQRVLEHDGILSTFHADVVLIPELNYGIVMLYNINSLPLNLVAFPTIKRGLMSLLMNEPPSPAAVSATMIEAIGALFTFVGVLLAVRSLLRLPAWKRRARATPSWRLIPGVLWVFGPAFVLLLLPSLIAMASDRVFSYASLLRTMMGVVLWLSLCAVLGIINGAMKLAWIAQRPRHEKSKGVAPEEE
jgi:CubicO group peptidase (beta-lactamase class C family)